MAKNTDFKPPTGLRSALEMIAPLDPKGELAYSDKEKRIAYERLKNFLSLLLPND